MIIGVVGTINSGKDTVGDLLKQKTGWQSFSLSDELRTVATERSLPLDNKTLNVVAVDLKTTHGLGHLAERGLKRFAGKDLIVTSLRNPGEIIPLQETGEFYLIGVDAPIELRYRRAIARARAGEEQSTFDDFQDWDQFTRNGPPDAQRIDDVMAQANIVIQNDTTFEELEQKIDAILADIL